MPDKLRDEPAGLIIRQDLVPLALAAFHGIPQQHTRQTKLPGVLPGRGKLKLLYVVVIDPPTYDL